MLGGRPQLVFPLEGPGDLSGDRARDGLFPILPVWRNATVVKSTSLSRGGFLLPAWERKIGVDLIKDPALLHAAYNDAQGVTAKFNLNLLRHAQRELGLEVTVLVVDRIPGEDRHVDPEHEEPHAFLHAHEQEGRQEEREE